MVDDRGRCVQAERDRSAAPATVLPASVRGQAGLQRWQGSESQVQGLTPVGECSVEQWVHAPRCRSVAEATSEAAVTRAAASDSNSAGYVAATETVDIGVPYHSHMAGVRQGPSVGPQLQAQRVAGHVPLPRPHGRGLICCPTHVRAPKSS